MSTNRPLGTGTDAAHRLISTAAAVSKWIGQPGGRISHRATAPTCRPMFIVSGSAGSNARPHSGQRLLVNPRSEYPHSQQEPICGGSRVSTVMRSQRYTSARW
jgi:hypothetical protein